MGDQPHDQKEMRERNWAARIIGAFLFVMGIVLYFVGQGYVISGTSIGAEWFGVLANLIGLSMIVFPQARWVQDYLDRLDDWPSGRRRGR